MKEFWILILGAFFAINSMDKAESVQLEETPLKTIDEIFGEGWWDNDKAEEWHKLTLEQTFHHQIDRQNAQLGQIEPNSTDQNPPLTESDSGRIESNPTDQKNPPLSESDHSGQIEPNSTDQKNPPLSESDHSGQVEPNSTDQNPPLTEFDHFGQIEPNSTDHPPLTEPDQFGQIEPNSTDQNRPLTEFDHFGQIEPNSTDQNPPLSESDHSGQFNPNSTDQNPPLTEFDHFGQIEPNSTDQNPPLTESDHSGQIEPNSTDQNPLLTESDHSNNAKNGGEQNQIMKEINSNEKRKIIDKFLSIKDEFKQKGKFSAKEWTQIENKIAKHLKISRKKIYKWKKEFGLSKKILYEKEERKHLIEKFDYRKAELMRAGFKNSYHNQINETVAKELGLNFRTISNWKRKLGQPRTNYSDDEKLEIVKKLMQMKSAHSGMDKKSCKEIDKEIVERFGVNVGTINQWKKEFGLRQKVFYKKNERQNLVKKFDQMKAELKRAGLKNSYSNQINETVAKELGLSFKTIYRWKGELGQTKPNHNHSHSEQKELMKRYYEIKDKIPKISDEDIAKMLKIVSRTLIRWKKQFKRQQFRPNSVDGHSVEENAAANIQEIGNSNPWSI